MSNLQAEQPLKHFTNHLSIRNQPNPGQPTSASDDPCVDDWWPSVWKILHAYTIAILGHKNPGADWLITYLEAIRF